MCVCGGADPLPPPLCKKGEAQRGWGWGFCTVRKPSAPPVPPSSRGWGHGPLVAPTPLVGAPKALELLPG